MEDIRFFVHGFVIIDLVPHDEMQTGRNITENLRDFINADKSELFCERYRCESIDHIIRVFDNIKQRIIENREVSYIHIEGHSSRECLEFPNGEHLRWSRVFEHFREINILSKNNLFFSSGACESAYAYKAAIITKPSPVFGMLAPEQHVKAGGVLDGYLAFFKSLIRNDSLNDAFEAFANATDSKRYALIFSQLLFKKAAYKYIKTHCMGKGRRKRLEDAVTKASILYNIPLNTIRRQLRKHLNKPQARNLRKFHDVFMMIDKYPENRNRFEFDAVKFERQVKSGELKIA